MDLSKPCKRALRELATVRSEMWIAEGAETRDNTPIVDEAELERLRNKYRVKFAEVLMEYRGEILEELLFDYQD